MSLLLALLFALPTPAEALAGEIDAHYNALRTVSVQFTQSYDGLGLHRVERGTLLLQKGGRLHEGKMRWSYSKPVGKLFVLDGRDGYFYTPGQNEVQRVPAKQLDDLRSPLALLLGHADLTKQLNGLTLTPAAGGEQTLSGVPRGLERRVSRLAITADSNGSIHELVIEETDGARNDFLFTNEHVNPSVSPGAFVFAPPPGTHVVSGPPPV